MKYAITHRLGIQRGVRYPKFCRAAVVEEFYKNGAYMVFFRAIREDTGKTIQRRLMP